MGIDTCTQGRNTVLTEHTGKNSNYCRCRNKWVKIVSLLHDSVNAYLFSVTTVFPFRETSWIWVLDWLDISVKSRFCRSWMEQKALCESDYIVSSAWKATVSLEADNAEQAVANSPGLPSMQTAFPHTASLYIMQWLHHIYKAWDVWGCQGQENSAVRWEINVRDERLTTVLLVAAWTRLFFSQ